MDEKLNKKLRLNKEVLRNLQVNSGIKGGTVMQTMVSGCGDICRPSEVPGCVTVAESYFVMQCLTKTMGPTC